GYGIVGKLRVRRSAMAKLFGSESRALDPAFVFLAAMENWSPERVPMIDIESFEPELYGYWPQRRAYGDALQLEADDAEARAAAEAYFLEIKSGPGAPAEELRVLLNEMTAEMRDQFSAFRELRRAAEAASAGGDEAATRRRQSSRWPT
ncbi:MAG: hypothetical protein AAAC50_01270, partial [Rhizobium altiplani]